MEYVAAAMAIYGAYQKNQGSDGMSYTDPAGMGGVSSRYLDSHYDGSNWAVATSGSRADATQSKVDSTAPAASDIDPNSNIMKIAMIAMGLLVILKVVK